MWQSLILLLVIVNIDLRRWFRLTPVCHKKKDTDVSNTRLGAKEFTGLFVMLVVGCIISYLLLAVKLMYLIRRDKTVGHMLL